LNGEPLNALTNAAFLVAAWGAWQLLKQVPDAHPKGLIRALIVLLAVVGLGSLLFHTVATKWAEWGDVYPILAFMVLNLWLILTYLLELPLVTRLISLAAVLGPAYWLESVSQDRLTEIEKTKEVVDPVIKSLLSGALYIPIVIALIFLASSLVYRRPLAGAALFTATAVWSISLTVRLLDLKICPSFWLGTHFVWHMTNAIVLFLFTSIVILYSGPAAARHAPA